MEKVISSPIRWTGSKKKLLNEMLYTFDREKEIYIEPFLGSGTVLINVLEKGYYSNYYVNDVNRSLIDFYRTLKENHERLSKMISKICKEYNELDTIDEKATYFYDMRKRYNGNRIKAYTRSSIFWFLMRTGYNGVYRVNLNGKFNVPFGKKKTIIFDQEKAEYISVLIQPVQFYCLGYQEFISELSEKIDLSKAFFYCDPPYIPETKSMENQVLYTKNRFEHSDFILHMLEWWESYYDLTFMISMSDSHKTDELYNIWELNKICVCDIIRSVNPRKKLVSKEVAFLNYIISEDEMKMADNTEPAFVL
ncbi:DNA adenine methylase [Listeria portnoyi]|uniref:DNA adenine methylase n=1 Tax=Listeria portnoyi TaxID=2713504 RepID=UPI001C9D3476|nr:Dam family site-specific DNA-(adenine-N6)-methyltransferase [Listeria portnoyi]